MPKHEKGIVVKTNNQELLEWKYLKVLVLRAQGLKYREIAEEVGVTETSVQRWFMRGGKLHGAFSRFNELAKQQSSDDVWTIIMGNLPDIARALVQTAKMPFDMTGSIVGTKLLEWGIGKAGDKNTAKHGGGGQLSYADYVKQQTAADKEEEQKNAGTELQNKPETTDAVSP